MTQWEYREHYFTHGDKVSLALNGLASKGWEVCAMAGAGQGGIGADNGSTYREMPPHCYCVILKRMKQ